MSGIIHFDMESQSTSVTTVEYWCEIAMAAILQEIYARQITSRQTKVEKMIIQTKFSRK